MEFYKLLQKDLDVDFIQQNLRLDNLNQYCNFVYNIISSHEDKSEIYCGRGLFSVQRDIIKKAFGFHYSTVLTPLQLA